MNNSLIALLSFACTLAPLTMAYEAPLDSPLLSAHVKTTKNGVSCTDWIHTGIKAADLKERELSHGIITDVGESQLRIYFPANWQPQDKRTALCIFPGGGYVIQAVENEGCVVAQWAAENGMVAVVVKYRVSEKNDSVGKFPGPLTDARHALRYVRQNALALGISPNRIGVMGFSAGAHLAAMASTLWEKALPEEKGDPLQNVSARPDFAMLIYPVITMIPQITHLGTRYKILGKGPSPQTEELCSVERQVTAKTPPIFLVQAQDDFVSCKNSQLMERACLEKGVPVCFKLYPKGGHGYGLEKRGQPTDQWTEDAKQWLQDRQLLPR